jgi:hypothetical protein
MDKILADILIERIQEDSLTWANNVFEREKSYLSEIEDIINISLDNSEGFKAAINYLSERLQTHLIGKEFKDIQKIENLLMAICVKLLSETIDLIIVSSPLCDNVSDLIFIAYFLGKVEGYRQALNEERPNWWDILTKHFHSIKCAKAVKEKRWEPRTKLAEELKEEVERYYKKGGATWHNDLAHAVKENKKFGDKFSALTLPHIKKAIGEVAEKYGWKRGIKK